MKTLKTKKLNIVTCWQNIKAIPPREFTSVKDMEDALVVIDCLEEAVPEFTKLLGEESEALRTKQAKLSREDYMKEVQALNTKISEVEMKEANNPITLEFENADFNVFFQLFEKNGKNWFSSVKEYVDFRKELNTTNQQPNGKTK